MYKLVSTISAFIRLFIFPNPFTRIFELYLANTMFSTSAIIFADIFNLVVGGTILCMICFPLVGIIYDRGDAPAMGSILYGVFVLVNSWSLSWASSGIEDLNFTMFVLKFIFILGIEVAGLFGIRSFKNNIYY